MTLTLTPDIEIRLRTFAEGQGMDVTELYNMLLNRGLDIAEAELANPEKTP
jgi:hypothetical protein